MRLCALEIHWCQTFFCGKEPNGSVRETVESAVLLSVRQEVCIKLFGFTENSCDLPVLALII